MSDLIAQIQAAQRDAGERAVIADLERRGLVPAASKPKAVEAGRITSLDLDGSTHVVPWGLLVSFDSPDKLRQAIADGRLEFSFLE
jgi:hypothetical protein